MDYSEVFERIESYVAERGCSLVERLGVGKDGLVYRTSKQHAVKGFVERRGYFNEFSIYMRLYDLGVVEVEGFMVPQYVDRDDELMVIEMSIVSPPCVLDFANAGLDGPLHDFPPEILQAEEERHREIFEARWPDVVRVRSGLRRHGVFIADLTPYNIMFPDDD